MNEKYKIKNLWGDLSTVEIVRTPYVILKEQAIILTEATNSLLIGSVDKKNFESNHGLDKYLYNFSCELKIIAPSIDNYSVSIAEIYYPKAFYPLTIKNLVTQTYSIECKSEEDVDTKLKDVLSSKKVKKVIFGLLNEVRLSKAETTKDISF